MSNKVTTEWIDDQLKDKDYVECYWINKEKNNEIETLHVVGSFKESTIFYAMNINPNTTFKQYSISYIYKEKPETEYEKLVKKYNELVHGNFENDKMIEGNFAYYIERNKPVLDHVYEKSDDDSGLFCEDDEASTESESEVTKSAWDELNDIYRFTHTYDLYNNRVKDFLIKYEHELKVLRKPKGE